MSSTRGLGRTDVARCWAGFASLGAGLIHIAVVREHLAEVPFLGVAFAVIGLAQVGWGLCALSRDSVPTPRAAAVVTLGLIAAWAMSRTVGLSLNPLTAVPEPVGVADVVCVVLEVTVIGCIHVAMSQSARVPVADQRRSATTARGLALLAAGALAVSALATPAMAATAAGDHAHGHDGEVVDHHDEVSDDHHGDHTH